MWHGDVGAREGHQRVHVSEQHGRIWTRFVLNVLNCAEIGNSEGLAERKVISSNCHSIINSLGCTAEEKLKTSNLPCFLPGLQGPRKRRVCSISAQIGTFRTKRIQFDSCWSEMSTRRCPSRVPTSMRHTASCKYAPRLSPAKLSN